MWILRGFQTLKNDIDISKIYNDHLVRLNEKRREELNKQRPTNKNYYRVSSSGMCSRKLYYESMLRLEPTEEINDKTRRIFRIGDLIHTDIQDALESSQRKETKEKL